MGSRSIRRLLVCSLLLAFHSAEGRYDPGAFSRKPAVFALIWGTRWRLPQGLVNMRLHNLPWGQISAVFLHYSYIVNMEPTDPVICLLGKQCELMLNKHDVDSCWVAAGNHLATNPLPVVAFPTWQPFLNIWKRGRASRTPEMFPFVAFVKLLVRTKPITYYKWCCLTPGEKLNKPVLVGQMCKYIQLRKLKTQKGHLSCFH